MKKMFLFTFGAVLMFTTMITFSSTSYALTSQQQQNVNNFAPKVYFHPDEAYYPGRVEDWLAHCEMRYVITDSRVFGLAGEPLSGLGSFTYSTSPMTVTTSNITNFRYSGELSDTSPKFYLKAKDTANRHGDNDGTVNAPVYVKYYSGYEYDEITYLFWYPHNGNIGPDVPDAASHEGDWESITIFVDKQTNTIEFAKYNSHHAEHDYFPASELEFEGTHPIVYSALDSHASYNLTQASVNPDSPSNWKIDRPASINPLCPDDHIGQGQTWETWNNIEILTNQNWLNYAGRWGDVSMSYKDGPYGPGASINSGLNGVNNQILFYSRDNCIGHSRNPWSTVNDVAYKMHDGETDDGPQIKNDDIRSLKLVRVKARTLIKLYDSPDGSTSDDYVEIYVKRNMEGTLRVNNLERYLDTEDVVVLPHNFNGLNGRVSRLEIKNDVTNFNIPESVAVFYEGNNLTQDIVGTLDLTNNANINLKHHMIENDELRSLELIYAKADTLLTFYDDPNGGTSDDYTLVYVKRDVNNIRINSLENYIDNSDVAVLPHNFNGLDGKVSRVKVQVNSNYNPPAGVIDFYEGNNCTQDKLDTWYLYPGTYTIDLTKQSFENDETRSLAIRNMRKGSYIALYDSPWGSQNDDYSYITLKQNIRFYPINTYEQNISNSALNLVHNHHNGLDGKVSRIVIWIP